VIAVWRTLLWLALVLVGLTPAQASLRLCNRMSYVVDAAIAIDDKVATATRGWFRIDPAACRVVLQGDLHVDRILLHARVLGVYGASPLPRDGRDMLCVTLENFIIAAARQCREGQTAVAFTEVAPTPTEDGNLVAWLAEDAAYDDEQARLAGIQRLLVVAGYDAAPIDGVDGPRTQTALATFLARHGLGAEVVTQPDFFQIMIKAAQTPSESALTWCNDTTHKVMAAIGIDDGKAITSRGWYRIDPGKCLHPDIGGQIRQIFSFAEALDDNNHVISRGSQALSWGGERKLCTRETSFETSAQDDCASRGFATTGFAVVDPASGGATLRFGDR